MKTLYLMGSRLRQYFLKNKLLFILFIIGGILTGTGVAYCYGNLLPIIATRDSQDAQYRSYSILFQKDPDTPGGAWEPADVSTDLETIEKFKSDPLIEACIFTNDNDYVCAYDENYPKLMLGGTDEFTGPYQVLVYEYSEAAVGDSINLRGHNFEVIGKCSFGFPGSLIPYDTYVSLGYAENTFRIYATSAERYAGKGSPEDPVKDLINELFPAKTHASASWGVKQDQIIAEKTLDEIPGIVINAFIAMLAYVFLLQYLVNSLLDETIVSIIVGASRLRMTVYIFWEALLLSVTANGLGLLLHWLLYKPLFSKINLATALTYQLADYLTLFIGMLLLSLLITVPFALKYLRLSPVAARREHA